MNIFLDDKNGMKLDDKYTSFFIDSADIGNNEIDEDKRDISGKTINQEKVNWLIFAFFAGLLILTGRIGYFQIVRGEYYNSISEGNRIRIQSIKPRRGIIYDKNYEPLVLNIPSFSLKIIQSDLPRDDEKRDELINDAAVLIGEDAAEIKKLLEQKKDYYYQPIIIKENIDYDAAVELYIRSVDMQGIILDEVSKRLYASSDGLSSISHILGYDGKISEQELKEQSDYLLDDYIGKAGVEESFEKYLRGELGKSQVETNALGKKIRIIAQKNAIPGADLVLAIDSHLQNYIENLLKEELPKIKKERASVIVMDPRNGEIISMVSIPSFNNNLFVNGISNEDYQNLINDKNRPLFNRSIAGAYPPGSTFKLLMAGIGLREGVINEKTKVRSTGGIWVGQWFFPDWRAGGHGIVDVKSAIANSVNTFFYTVGGGYNDFAGLGMERIVKNLNSFNFGQKTGIDLPGESPGFLPDEKWKQDKFNEPWYIGDTYHLSIGQGYLLATPIQIALYTSFYANGGTLYKPQIAKYLIYPGNRKEEIPPEIIKKDIISEKNVQIVREGMRDGVIYGSAGALRALPFSVAGKTGTAQTSPDKDPHAWFTCFAPYENPEIEITVLIEDGGEGSSVSVPIAKKILEYWGENRK
ncbi:MAG: penicillin-binding protein 2 [bacterium]